MIIDEEHFTKSISKIAIPAVMEQILIMIVGVVSLIFVGHISNEAVTSVGFVNSLFAFVQAVFVALSTGCTVIIARLIGEGDITNAKSAMKQSVGISFLIACVLAVFLIVFAGPVIKVFFNGAEQTVIDMSIQYFQVTLITLPLMIANIIISGSLRGAGDSKTPMLIANLVNIINIVLSYVLIFGITIGNTTLGKIGFIGAAIAVCISRGIGGVLSLLVILNRKTLLYIRLKDKFRVDLPLMYRILKIGIPASFEQMILQGGIILLQVLISRMGTESTAVYQIVMSINSICYTPISGFGISAITLVGQSLGAKRVDLAKKSGWETMKFCLIIVLVLSLLLFIFAGKVMSIYTDDEAIIAIGARAIRLYCFSQPFVGITIILSNSLRGAGDIAYVMLTSFAGIWCMRIAITFALDYFLRIGLDAVWIATFMDFSVRSVLYIIRFRKGKWANIKV